MPGIFISYRRKDTGGYAGRLQTALADRYGRKNVFMDIDSIPGGTPFENRIEEALESSHIALALIGERWAGSKDRTSEDGPTSRIGEKTDLVRKEVAAALEHKGVSVVPVLVEEAGIPSSSELPDDLSALPGLEARQLRNKEWKADVGRLCQAIEDIDGWREWILWIAARTRRLLARRWAPATAIVAVAALIAVLGLGIGRSDPALACTNLSIPDEVRSALSSAAGQSAPAVRDSVYYGRCGSPLWALAEFPGKSNGVFVESGFHWQLLGPEGEVKCERVPKELLDLWTENDC